MACVGGRTLEEIESGFSAGRGSSVRAMPDMGTARLVVLSNAGSVNVRKGDAVRKDLRRWRNDIREVASLTDIERAASAEAAALVWRVRLLS